MTELWLLISPKAFLSRLCPPLTSECPNKRISFYQSECLLLALFIPSFHQKLGFLRLYVTLLVTRPLCCNVTNRVIPSGSTRCMLVAIYCSRCWKYCGEETQPCPGGADRLVGTKATKRGVQVTEWLWTWRALGGWAWMERRVGAWALLGLEAEMGGGCTFQLVRSRLRSTTGQEWPSTCHFSPCHQVNSHTSAVWLSPSNRLLP